MKLGIIGLGSMSTALLEGLHSVEFYNMSTIYASTHSQDTLENISKAFSINPAYSNKELVDQTDIILLAVKPEDLPLLAEEIKPYLHNKPIISIAAKTSINTLIELFGERPIIRIMPNLSVKFRQSVTAITYHNTTQVQEEFITNLFSILGTILEIPESQFSGFIGLSSSAIALVFKFIDAIAKSGLEENFTYEQALRIVSLTTKSAAHNVLNSKETPPQLIARVASKKGTTAKGLEVLDDNNFDAIINMAIKAIIEKDKKG